MIEDLSIAQSQAEEDHQEPPGPHPGIRAGPQHGQPRLCVSRQPSGRPAGGQPALPGCRRCARPGRDGDCRAAGPIGRLARTSARGRGRPGPLGRAGPRRHPPGRPGPVPDHRGRPGHQPGPRLFVAGFWGRHVGPRVAGACRPSSSCKLRITSSRSSSPARPCSRPGRFITRAMQQALMRQMTMAAEQRRQSVADGGSRVERRQLRRRRRHGRGGRDPRASLLPRLPPPVRQIRPSAPGPATRGRGAGECLPDCVSFQWQWVYRVGYDDRASCGYRPISRHFMRDRS